MRKTIWISSESNYNLVKISNKLCVTNSELIRRALQLFYQKGDHKLTKGDKKLLLRDEKERKDLILKFDMGKVFFYRNALKIISKAIAFSHDKKHIYAVIDSFIDIGKNIYDDKKAIKNFRKIRGDIKKAKNFDAIKQEISQYVIINEYKNTARKVRIHPEIDLG